MKLKILSIILTVGAIAAFAYQTTTPVTLDQVTAAKQQTAADATKLLTDAQATDSVSNQYLNQQITAMQAQITTLQTQVAALQAAPASPVTAAQFTALQTQVSALQTQATTMQASIRSAGSALSQ